MLRLLATTSAKLGLRINFLKTKVLTWDALSGNHERVDVHGQHVDILREEESERYLGRKLAFSGCHAKEVANRMAAGWVTFHNTQVRVVQ